MTDFNRTRRPPKDKCLEFQLDSLDLIRYRRGSQKAECLGFPPTGNPKYTKEKESTLQFNTSAASHPYNYIHATTNHKNANFNYFQITFIHPSYHLRVYF